MTTLLYPRPERIREIFLDKGFTIKPGQDDLKGYVYAAAYALIKEIQTMNMYVGDVPKETTSNDVRVHYLKCDHACFVSLRQGHKKAEVRLDDRQYKADELISMKETVYTSREMSIHNMPLSYTGRQDLYRITHIQRGYGLPTDMVVMSLENVLQSDV